MKTLFLLLELLAADQVAPRRFATIQVRSIRTEGADRILELKNATPWFAFLDVDDLPAPGPVVKICSEKDGGWPLAGKGVVYAAHVSGSVLRRRAEETLRRGEPIENEYRITSLLALGPGTSARVKVPAEFLSTPSDSVTFDVTFDWQFDCSKPPGQVGQSPVSVSVTYSDAG